MNATAMTVLMILLLAPMGLSAQTGGTRASATVEATARAGLPEAPVREAVAEARARGESETQVDRAALAARASLQASREALRNERRGEPNGAEISAGARALLAGARPADLRRVSDAAPGQRSLTASLDVLTEMSARGADPSRAAAALAARLQAGASDRAIAGLGTTEGSGSLQLPSSAGAAGAAGAAVDLGGAIDLRGASVGIGASLLGGVGGL